MTTTQTSTIQVRIDNRTKIKAQAIFKKLGIDLSSAMKLFLSQVIRTKSIPFIAKTENGFTPAYEKMIIDEWKAMKAGKELSFNSIKGLMADLNN